MLGYLKRLVTTGAAYQFGDIVAKGLALITLPLYTRHLDPSAYGAAESLLTAVILSSILAARRIGEAFIRFYFDDEDVRAASGSRARRRPRSRGRRRSARCWRSCSPGRSRGCCSASMTRF